MVGTLSPCTGSAMPRSMQHCPRRNWSGSTIDRAVARASAAAALHHLGSPQAAGILGAHAARALIRQAFLGAARRGRAAAIRHLVRRAARSQPAAADRPEARHRSPRLVSAPGPPSWSRPNSRPVLRQEASIRERMREKRQAFVHPIIETGVVVGELFVTMGNAELVQAPHEPSGAVKQVELVPLAAVDV
jgi:hypothetical protein